MVRGFDSLIPFHRTVLRSQLSPGGVRDALAQTTSAEVRWFGGSGDGTTFHGTVGSESFEIVRRIHYRNSFLPVVRGTIEAVPGGTLVRLDLRLHAFVLVFMAIWMTLTSFVALAALALALTGEPNPMLAAFAFPIFGALLTGFAFRAEANIAIERLCALFEAKEDA